MASIESSARTLVLALMCAALLAASCAGQPQVETVDTASATTIVRDAQADDPPPSPTTAPTPSDEEPSSATPPAENTDLPGDGLLAGGVDPDTLVTTPEGDVIVQATPEALRNRQLPTSPRLPAPVSDTYESSIQPLEGNQRQRSTWNELCPVPTTSLRYVTVSFWGFDGVHHTGELIVAANEAENMVGVFRRLHAVRFPIEEMRIVTPADVVARRTGDGNNTASYVCRQVTGGTRFSEHALGLAVDVNPFQNPYRRDAAVIPALASSYLDRSNVRPGMIVAGDPVGDEVIAAFADIGWEWGGNWSSLKDYQHFARDNR